MTEWQPTQRDALEALSEIEAYLESPATDGGWFNDRCAVIRTYILNVDIYRKAADEVRHKKEKYGDLGLTYCERTILELLEE